MKNAKLIIDGKEIKIQLSEDELKKLDNLSKTNKITGYERVEGGQFYYANDCGTIESSAIDTGALSSNIRYDTANYYSNIGIANNNARADKLMRQLRRFAVEHRQEDTGWTDTITPKHYIYYDYELNKINISEMNYCRDFGQIYFDTEEVAELAVETFKDELAWYFTEYCDSL